MLLKKLNDSETITEEDSNFENNLCNFEKVSQDVLAASQAKINSQDEAVFQPEKVSQNTMNSLTELTIQAEMPQAEVPLSRIG